ncbi:hypothetical protein NDU88_003565 [Pleurodeles waltl]|uniref:Uncharacterized protein n=1 Tax=Pleurodeles waltl TaxID=8319 RepID=A0AAV7QC39_PLEWA|nr:hypothetical protein NDU88_003565 [Pleurodeles waltl]
MTDHRCSTSEREYWGAHRPSPVPRNRSLHPHGGNGQPGWELSCDEGRVRLRQQEDCLGLPRKSRNTRTLQLGCRPEAWSWWTRPSSRRAAASPWGKQEDRGSNPTGYRRCCTT